MDKELIDDISATSYTSRVTIDNPKNIDTCISLKTKTNARICVGRAADRFKTDTLLRFRADHAVAVDTVWAYVDETIIDEMNFVKVQTLITDKEEYITRPDLGRCFSKETIAEIKSKCISNPLIQIIVADGLSARAIDANVKEIYSDISKAVIAKGYKLGTPIFVKYGRVATMDKISEALNATVTVLLVGERPGLATDESMSCYMAYEASSLKPESQRTVVSNIHKNGTPAVEAAVQIVNLIDILLREKISGVGLKI